MITRTAPEITKFMILCGVESTFGCVKKQRKKNTTQIPVDIHINVRQLPNCRIIPPILGPKITEALDRSM